MIKRSEFSNLSIRDAACEYICKHVCCAELYANNRNRILQPKCKCQARKVPAIEFF